MRLDCITKCSSSARCKHQSQQTPTSSPHCVCHVRDHNCLLGCIQLSSLFSWFKLVSIHYYRLSAHNSADLLCCQATLPAVKVFIPSAPTLPGLSSSNDCSEKPSISCVEDSKSSNCCGSRPELVEAPEDGVSAPRPLPEDEGPLRSECTYVHINTHSSDCCPHSAGWEYQRRCVEGYLHASKQLIHLGQVPPRCYKSTIQARGIRPISRTCWWYVHQPGHPPALGNHIGHLCQHGGWQLHAPCVPAAGPCGTERI